MKKATDIVVWYLILTCIFLVPFFSPHVFRAPSVFLYILLSVCLLIYAIREKRHLKDFSLLLPLSACLIVIVISSVFSVKPAVSFHNASYFFFYILLFVMIAGLDYDAKKKVIIALISASFFISARAILQYFIYFDEIIPHIILSKPKLTGGEFSYLIDAILRRRVISTFDNPNLLGAYLATINILILGFILSSYFINKGKRRIFHLSLLFIINLYSLWLTRSLVSMAGLIFGVILFVFLLSAQDNKKFKHSKHLILYFAIPLIVIFAILFIGRIYSLADTDRISLSLKGRMDFWKAGIYAIIKKPLSFLGLGNFGHLYTIYPALSYLKSRMAHNIILQLWVETGPYGVFAFLWFFTVLVRNRLTYILKAKAIDEKFILHMAILSAVSTFLFNNLADFSFFLPQTAIIWWVLSALIAKD